MQPTIRFLILVLAWLLAGCTTARMTTSRGTPAADGSSAMQPRASANSSAQQLDRLAATAWQWWLVNDAGLRNSVGLPFTGNHDLGLRQAQRDAAFARRQLVELQLLGAAELDPERETTRRFLVKTWEDVAQQPDNWVYDFVITPYSGVLPLTSLIERAAAQPVQSRRERIDHLFVLAEIGRLLEQMAAKTRLQAEAGIRLPRAALPSLRATYRAVAASATKLRAPGEPEASLPPREVQDYRRRVEQLVDGPIQRGFAAILSVLDDDYAASAPESVGLGHYAGGEARYRRAIVTYTGFRGGPAELHQRGLELTADLQLRMAAVRRRLGFEGSREEFHAFLNHDARFKAGDVETLEKSYREQLARIEVHVPQYFSRLPRAGYGIRRIPGANEGAVAFGYYEPPGKSEPLGLFRFNGANLDQRSMVQSAAINFHELVPGHHFHLALQAENEALPRIRRNFVSLKLSAFNEGWAQYAANLAEEMGALKDDYELYGLLATDAMMSARLVVDTGLNALGWDLDRARRYLLDNTLMSPEQVSAEVLRYATDVPGQALAYKLGHVRILQLRQRTRQTSGDCFDVRQFHDAVLSGGALPLEVLEWRVDHWLGARTCPAP